MILIKMLTRDLISKDMKNDTYDLLSTKDPLPPFTLNAPGGLRSKCIDIVLIFFVKLLDYGCLLSHSLLQLTVSLNK